MTWRITWKKQTRQYGTEMHIQRAETAADPPVVSGFCNITLSDDGGRDIWQGVQSRTSPRFGRYLKLFLLDMLGAQGLQSLHFHQRHCVTRCLG